MSDKMKRFLDKKVVKTVQQIVENHTTNCTKPYNNILNESEQIRPEDKEVLYQSIQRPGNRSYVLQSYQDVFDVPDRTIVISRKSGTMVHLAYNSELVEITDFLVNMCDEMGYAFHTADQKSPAITSFIVIVR
jgi:hypothetical protein